MKKKLVLHRTTIAILTAPALAHVVGGVPGGPQSIKVTTKIEPCQCAETAVLCTIAPP